MSYQYIRSVKDGGVAHLELDRPESLNAWTPEMGLELLDALNAVSADPSARAVLLTGAGRAFSAGADVKRERDVLPNGDLDLSSWLRDIYNPCVLAVREMPKPVVGAIQGAAAGLGASLALSVRLAGRGGVLVSALRVREHRRDARRGCAALPRRTSRNGPRRRDRDARRTAPRREGAGVGPGQPGRAGRRPCTPKGWRWRSVSRSAPRWPSRTSRQTLNETSQPDLASQLAVEADRQQIHGGSFDYQEGRSAFIEKRRAQFQGR